MNAKEELISIINAAINATANDIRFTLRDDNVEIFFRVGYGVEPHHRILIEKYKQLLAYIRFNASMDLTHPMQPQSGEFTIDDVICRVSILPTSSRFDSMILTIKSGGGLNVLHNE